MSQSQQPRIIVGISGASGIIYGIRLLQVLREMQVETHLVISKAAQQTRAVESEFSAQALEQLADFTYHPQDISASIASGSFKTAGMIIAPCSMRTLADIAHGSTASLMSRAADVILKERRRLVLMVRESPFHLGHLENMLKVTQMGGVIAPPIPAFYTKPTQLADIVDHSVGRVLDLFDMESGLVKRWT
jgi:flavin prenyltransferase